MIARRHDLPVCIPGRMTRSMIRAYQATRPKVAESTDADATSTPSVDRRGVASRPGRNLAACVAAIGGGSLFSVACFQAGCTWAYWVFSGVAVIGCFGVAWMGRERN
jgi:hypothetical protein